MSGRIGDFFAGVRLVREGFRVWRSSPRLTLIGLIPGAISALLLVGVFAAIAIWVDDWAQGIAAGLTGDPTPNGLLVALVALGIIGGSVFLAIFTFTALTLLIGQPFFEAIVDTVAPAAGLEYTVEEEPWWRSTLRGMREGAGLLALGGGAGIAFFFIGLIPVIGSTTAFLGSALVGGTLLTLELTSYPLNRVGIVSLGDRRRAIRSRRPLALGFGVTAYLICLVPLGAVLAMPALVAGATLLAARIVPSEPPRAA